MTFSLPFPPTANHLFATVSRKRIKTEAYRVWLQAAGWELKSQNPAKVSGEYRMSVLAFRPDRRRRDIGNIEKAISDLLVSHGIVEDDHLARSIHLEWADTPMIVPAHVRVTVEPVT